MGTDGWGRAQKLVDERGNVQWREYDLLGRITIVHEPDGNVRSITYDSLSNIVRTQERQHDVQYVYRGMGRMIRRIEAGTAVEFLHDTEEQLRAIVNEHGLAYRFELDGEGDVTTEVGFDGLSQSYRRDVGGRVQELVLPDGQLTRYGYDRAGRTTEVLYGDGAAETYQYRADGALLAALNDTIQVELERDVVGNVLQEKQGDHTIKYSYDLLGNRISTSSTLGAGVRYTRNAAGAVEQVRTGNWQAHFERDMQGLEVQRLYSGGIRTRWKRDTLGRPIEHHISNNTTRSERTRSHSWQEKGLLTQIQDSKHGLTRFEHDAVGNRQLQYLAMGHASYGCLMQ